LNAASAACRGSVGLRLLSSFIRAPATCAPADRLRQSGYHNQGRRQKGVGVIRYLVHDRSSRNVADEASSFSGPNALPHTRRCRSGSSAFGTRDADGKAQ
jgi:hypothetical protein